MDIITQSLLQINEMVSKCLIAGERFISDGFTSALIEDLNCLKTFFKNQFFKPKNLKELLIMCRRSERSENLQKAIC